MTFSPTSGRFWLQEHARSKVVRTQVLRGPRRSDPGVIPEQSGSIP